MIGPQILPFPNDVRAAAVALFDANGVQLSGFDSSRPSTAVLTQLTVSNTAAQLLAANPARRQFIVVNESSKVLYLAFGATATVSAYTVQVPGGQTYTSPLDGFTGLVSAIWSANDGTKKAQITELS